ncbi:MAG: uroporphyrinogen-III C-methyltransferase [Betaproteobacteria bacterium]|nr:uroporphyrinogen-III C-methyltransferase [Betaproteobacteria bacterium]
MPDEAFPKSPLWRSPALWLAGVALVGLLALAWNTHDRLRDLETQLARRIGEFDAASRDARAAAAAANTALADLNRRLASLEARALETQNQQLALNAMYQDLARSADERVVADIEQTLLLAQQQLQLAGNIKAALIGMDAAHTRLRQLNKPQFAALEKAIAQDAERLKLLPAADIPGLNARLEGLILAVDSLKPESEAEAPPPPAATRKSGPVDALARLTHEAWGEFKSLVRIRRLDHPELPLLTPSQSYFLSQNLKLRLLSARLCALQRDEVGFRADLGAAREWGTRYFNRQDKATQAFLNSLEELRRAPVAQQDAQIGASLKAVRASRGSRQ